MGIRISQGGRLFGIVAGLGGVAMIGSAALTWPAALAITRPERRINELIRVDGLTMLLLGLVVVAGAAGLIALGSDD